MFDFIHHSNIEACVIKLLKSLSINITPSIIATELEKHPDYPSLLAISDVLTALHIENIAFRIKYDDLANVPTPFIAHTRLNSGDFVVVNRIEENAVAVSSDKWNYHQINAENFKQIFDGVVLTVEPSLDGYAQIPRATAITLATARIPFIAISSLLLLVAALVFKTNYFINLNWKILLLTLFKTAGLITSILLLMQSIDSYNPLIQRLCQAGSKTDCKNILSSKAAKVFEGLTWSEVGFFYFAGTWLLLLFGNHSVSLMQILAVLNIVSLPYTFYSIYYQAKVARQWCVLCCTIQALLWLEFIPLVTAFNQPVVIPTMVEWSSLLIALLLPVVLWILFKPLFQKAQQLKPLKEQLRKFKYNQQLFNKMLNDQPRYAQPDESWSIVLGNVEANNSITMVTNPYCPPCAKTHKLLDELLDQRSDIQARIVFTASNTDEDIRTPVSRHLMALNELTDKTIIKRALNDWYEQKQKNYEAWTKVYPVQLNEAEYYKIDKQKGWCEMAEVTGTPTMLLNGYRLPDLYQLSDLKYMLD